MDRIALFLTLIATALGSTDPLPKAAQLTFTHGDRRIGTYISSPEGFETSSYWIEGPSGLIWIDTQFLLSAGEEALNWAEKATGKKVELAIVLHPNPDKFNGTLLFKKRGIRVVTSEQVRSLVPEVHKDRHYWFYERYKPDYPNEVPLPDSFGNQTQELSAGGITVKAHVLGAGCSDAHVVVEYDDHLFVGDLVTNNSHSWIELGKIESWLTRLKELSALEPEYVHPGRGPNGGAELIDREQAYLNKVLALVRAERPVGAPKPQKISRLQAKIEALYPGYANAHFVEIGLPAVWKAQSKNRRAK